MYADGTGKVTGYAGPNPQNGSDPNANTQFDWYEMNYAYNAGDGSSAIFINTTQVDEFGLPLLLDVWASKAAFHKQVGISETIAQFDSEFTAQVPAAFQPATMSNLRIFLRPSCRLQPMARTQTTLPTWCKPPGQAMRRRR